MFKRLPQSALALFAIVIAGTAGALFVALSTTGSLWSLWPVATWAAAAAWAIHYFRPIHAKP